MTIFCFSKIAAQQPSPPSYARNQPLEAVILVLNYSYGSLF